MILIFYIKQKKTASMHLKVAQEFLGLANLRLTCQSRVRGTADCKCKREKVQRPRFSENERRGKKKEVKEKKNEVSPLRKQWKKKGSYCKRESKEYVFFDLLNRGFTFSRTTRECKSVVYMES